MVRLALLAAACLCLLAAPALAQKPFDSPTLSGKPTFGKGAEATATPAPTATATATAEPTATARPAHQRDRADLPNTGADPLRLALAGFTMLGFGLALRFRVALADARRPEYV